MLSLHVFLGESNAILLYLVLVLTIPVSLIAVLDRIILLIMGNSTAKRPLCTFLRLIRSYQNLIFNRIYWMGSLNIRVVYFHRIFIIDAYDLGLCHHIACFTNILWIKLVLGVGWSCLDFC